MKAYEESTTTLAKFFAKHGFRRVYQKGDFIIRPGEISPGVFYIESGLVKSYDITKYGEENLLVIRRPGELLGMTLTLTGDDRHIIYTALSKATLWVIEHEAFKNFVQTKPEFSYATLTMLADMYRVNSERILNLEYRTVRERIISFLLSMALRFGSQQEAGIFLDVPLRKQDIASSVSATRETTGRELAILERKGLIAQKNQYITLLDTAALRRFL